VSNFPARAQRADPIVLQTRKLIEDAERAAAMHTSDLTEFARQILAGRRQRERFFDPLLFSNPAWDVLLNLYVAEADGRLLSVLDCCIVPGVPQGVVLRWLGYLKQEEMVSEVPDPIDPRRSVIRLSESTRLAISAYLGSLISLGLGPEFVIPDFTPPKTS
jgi:hypothetical protein